MKLSGNQLQAALQALSGWQGEDTGIAKEFTFQSYADGVAFAMKVALLAEKMNHHPDGLTIGWKKVRVVYVTHDAGGVTELDVEAARKVNAL
ncbi:4a-hydroxytetrahydrobiopterin dehydratase [Deinococcus cellulosilyticus]|uniref:4a-hydroxytetrahydrobiopterin dehydratase n=1 Tax=Deinococcus cellulosilyticus (strain DSM 18568 / NBRC 106333 / KACC 11606 / 5516J-15) TaxID=1223518 RepID=A0A511N3L5_DEIC1|nr:4a-hydroxytetrahydrobiopterin dehydratase [Deinococcus cellulosilyticus]GEM47464.1 4a-hydroxytetrahydrobiopterin dehydratase [Deinococcus cellulosilyticus NBRC 106333 = KACC 11606]